MDGKRQSKQTKIAGDSRSSPGEVINERIDAADFSATRCVQVDYLLYAKSRRRRGGRRIQDSMLKQWWEQLQMPPHLASGRLHWAQLTVLFVETGLVGFDLKGSLRKGMAYPVKGMSPSCTDALGIKAECRGHGGWNCKVGDS